MNYDIDPQMIMRKIAAVELAPDKEHLTIRFQDGGYVNYFTEGDCCSHSWVEHLEVPKDTIGATLLKITETEMPDRTIDNHPEHDCLKFYDARFVTDRGEIVVEFRNASNGYYGGWLTVTDYNLPPITVPVLN